MDKIYLTHSGVKGMKWGIRRYQNKDGSLTPAGRKRYGQRSSDSEVVSKLKTKKVSELSNDELRKVNERTRLENEYSKLNPSAIKKGIAWVTATTAFLGTAANLYTNGEKLVGLGKQAVKAFGNAKKGI